MNIRGVKFRVGQEWRVGGLYYPEDASPTPAVLMLHGFPGVQKNEDIAADLCRRGFTVFMPYFGGCWGSSGSFEVDGLLADARAALALLSRYHHVDAERLGLLGYSVGGWIGLRLAAERPMAAVVALAPAVPLNGGLGDDRYLRKNSRTVSMRSVPDVWKGYLRAANNDRPTIYLPRISPSPLLLVQGQRDRMVPARSIERLFALAREPRQLLELPDEDHEFQTDRRHVVNEICSWLQSRMSGPGVRRPSPPMVEGQAYPASMGIPPAEKMLGTLLNDHEAVIRRIVQNLETCSRHRDYGTQNLLRTLMQGHERVAQKLRIHLKDYSNEG